MFDKMEGGGGLVGHLFWGYDHLGAGIFTSRHLVGSPAAGEAARIYSVIWQGGEDGGLARMMEWIPGLV